MKRSRRVEPPVPVDDHRPLYARMLRLRFVAPGGLLCFVFLEGAIALGLLLALAELVSWWGVLVLPLTVALMVKLNDVIAGSLARVATPARPAGMPGASRPATAQAHVLRPAVSSNPGALDRAADEVTTRLPAVIDRGRGNPVQRPWAERVEAQQQWMRQSATRRYE
jgi:hypothetical protein